MNRTEIIGFIGQDAEVRGTDTNQVINFSVAVTEKWTDKQGQKQEKTYWYRCAKWSNNVAILPYLTKGTQVYVSGVCVPNSYINQQGEIVQAQGLTVRNIQLLGGGSGSQAKPAATPKAQVPPAPTRADFEQQEDDLPF